MHMCLGYAELAAVFQTKFIFTFLLQVKFSIGALSKSLYERMFKWLVGRVNKTLDTKVSTAVYLGYYQLYHYDITMTSL